MSVQRINAFPDPVFKRGGWEQIGNVSAAYGQTNGQNHELGLKATSDVGGSVKFIADAITPGAEYVFRANVWISSAAEPYEDGPFMIGYTKTDGFWRWLLNAAMWKQGSNTILKRFTVPSDAKNLTMQLSTPTENGAIANWSCPQLELANTYDSSLPFFYYGTMPDPRSAS